MPFRIWCISMTAILLATTAGAQTPGPDQLTRFQEKVRQDITGLPNYTCLETIERSRRDPHAHSFKPVDTVRIEVSSVEGKEMFAWPGSNHFEDQKASSQVHPNHRGSMEFENRPETYEGPNGQNQNHGSPEKNRPNVTPRVWRSRRLR